jgi:molybdopterin-binding protein
MTKPAAELLEAEVVTHVPGGVIMTPRRPEPKGLFLLPRSTAMLSARNQLPATVKSVKLGGVMAEVVMTVGDIELVAVISRASAEALDLKTGDTVKAIIKSTEMMIDKP